MSKLVYGTNLKRVELVPTTKESHPFGTAVEKCKLKENGYIEEEYFIHGIANVYSLIDGKKGVMFADSPYINRIIIRRPAAVKSFSGNVVIEILNSTAGYDIDRNWVLTKDFMMRNGDIYVGITSKPNVIKAMLKFDQERYSALSWENPNPTPNKNIPKEKLGNIPDHSSYETEDGLFWDMLIDLAKLLKSDSDVNPIQAYGNHYQYLSGWSQSGGYLIRFIKDFAYDCGDDKLFNGYLSYGAVSLCTPNLSQEDFTDPTVLDLTLPELKHPLIEVHTESENVSLNNNNSRMKDGEYYRCYDIVGPSHNTLKTSNEYYENDSDLEKAGFSSSYYGKESFPNNFPLEFVFNAAQQSMYKWVREGKQPISEEPIKVDSDLNNVKDENGNSIGGWRLPLINYPVCKYVRSSTPVSQEFAFSCSIYGYEEPFSKKSLKAMYGSLENYTALIKKDAQSCVGKGLLLSEDMQSCIDLAVENAKKYGLE